MPTKTRPALLARPSRRTLTVLGLLAAVSGVFFFPFVFGAFGRRDNPFDAPIELVWIALLALGSFAVLLIIGVARRSVLKAFDI